MLCNQIYLHKNFKTVFCIPCCLWPHENLQQKLILVGLGPLQFTLKLVKCFWQVWKSKVQIYLEKYYILNSMLMASFVHSNLVIIFHISNMKSKPILKLKIFLAELILKWTRELNKKFRSSSYFEEKNVEKCFWRVI